MVSVNDLHVDELVLVGIWADVSAGMDAGHEAVVVFEGVGELRREGGRAE